MIAVWISDSLKLVFKRDSHMNAFSKYIRNMNAMRVSHWLTDFDVTG